MAVPWDPSLPQGRSGSVGNNRADGAAPSNPPGGNPSYSDRSASTGSTRAALRAGIQDARRATVARPAAVPT